MLPRRAFTFNMETLAGTNSRSRNHLWVLEFGVFTDSQLAKEGLHK